MTGPRPRPPEVADRLLRLFLPPGALGDSIRGDLWEEFEERPSRGWFWRNTLLLSGRYAMKRLLDSWGARRALRAGANGYGGWDRMRSLWKDVRFGLRMVVKTPLLSIVAIVTIGMGVGLTTHMFSSVHGGVLKPLPVPDPERLAYIGAVEQGDFTANPVSIHDFDDIRRAVSSFDAVEGFYQGTVNVAGEEAPPERYRGAFVTAGALGHVGVEPILGRVFRAGEDGPDAPHQIVIGHHVWANRFARDPGIVGRTIRVNGFTTEIIGVMPEGFRFPFLEDVWVPMRTDAADLERGSGIYVTGFGRVREEVGFEGANAELEALGRRLADTYPETNAEVVLKAGPYDEFFMPPAITSVLWIMLVATFGVLLIACANVANILLARASVRAKEVAVRTALGASRWRVVRQLLVEALVLALFGGLVGLGLNEIGQVYYGAAVDGIYKPYWLDFGTNVPVLLFSLAVTGLAALLAGVLPALRTTGLDVGETLKDESRGSSSLRLGRLSSFLVISEIAVSCALLVGAGFMIQSVVNVNRLDLGFEADRVLVGRIGLFDADYPTEEARDRLFQDLQARLNQEPGVVRAALGTSTPGLGAPGYYVAVEGRTYSARRDYPVANTAMVTPGFFETLGVSLLEGRDFTALEAQLDGEPVAIVSESFVDRYLAGETALGARVRFGVENSDEPWMRIVGVVPDLYVGGNTGGIGNDRLPAERLFVPQGTLGDRFTTIHLRTAGPPAQFASRLRSLVAELDPNLPVYGLGVLDTAIAEANWAFGLFGGMFGIFGLAALFLAAVGLYGVMAFSVSQRRRELGLRMALGAHPRDLVGMIVSRGARQLGIGMAVGLLIGIVTARSLRVILYGVETGDLRVYLAIAATLGAVGLLAVLIPARGATRADPVEAMRAG